MRVRNSSSKSNNRRGESWDRNSLRRMNIILVEEGEGGLMGMLRLRGDCLYMCFLGEFMGLLSLFMGMILGMVTVMGDDIAFC